MGSSVLNASVVIDSNKYRQIIDSAFKKEKDRIQLFGTVQTRNFIAFYIPTCYILNVGIHIKDGQEG